MTGFLVFIIKKNLFPKFEYLGILSLYYMLWHVNCNHLKQNRIYLLKTWAIIEGE
jgi:hypothetical protein